MPPQPDDAPPVPSLRWMFLDLNSYFASVEQQEVPALRGRPVGVVPSEGENTCVIAASVEARRLGVRTGTPLREARRLAPGIVLVPARHDLYVAYHRRVLEEVERHLPVSRAWSVDEVSARLLGPQRGREAALSLARAVKAGLARRVGACLRCSVGLAPSWRLAKIATELEKPDGLVALEASDLPGRLLGLSLRDLPGIGARVAARLERHGVTGVAALWEMGPRRARLAWGSVEGERFWRGLRGEDVPEPPLRAVPHSLGHARVLPPALRGRDEARHVARLLAMKATSRLREGAFLASLLVLSVEYPREAEPPALSGDARLLGTDDERVVLSVLEELWAILPGDRFWRVSVVLADLQPAARATSDLFDWAERRERRGAPSGLSAALDSIHRRFGRASLVLGPRPRDREAYEGRKIAFSSLPGALPPPRGRSRVSGGFGPRVRA